MEPLSAIAQRLFEVVMLGQYAPERFAVTADEAARHAAGLLPPEEAEAILRRYLFHPWDQRFPHWKKLGPRDVRHASRCRGYDEGHLVGYTVVSPYDGRGLTATAFAAYGVAQGVAEESRLRWRVLGIALPGLAETAVSVAPLLHVARCTACGKERAQEALEVMVRLPGGSDEVGRRVFSRQFLAVGRESGPSDER